MAVVLVASAAGRAAADPQPPAPTPPAAPTPAPAPPSTPATAVPAPAPVGDGPVRLSLPTESDRQAWRLPGFRLSLGVVYGRLVGLRGAPSGRLLGPVLRLGMRLDRDWSLMTTFQYASASAAGGLSGLRYAGTLEPTWHATKHASIAIGVGFGGIVEGRTGRPDADPLPSTLDSSYTFPDSSHPMASCKGVGAAASARIDWMYVLGRRASTGVALELLGQWTGCVDDTGRVEPDTAEPIVRRQFWPHVGFTLSWNVAWR